MPQAFQYDVSAAFDIFDIDTLALSPLFPAMSEITPARLVTL